MSGGEAPGATAPGARVAYGRHPDQWVEVHCGGERPRGTVALIHGGYWRHRFDASLMRPLAAALAAAGWRVANLEYRRVDPEDAPADRVDATGIVADVGAALATLDEAGLRAGPLVLVGHSAGGQLALLHAPAADAVVALAPVTDLARGYREHIGEDAVAELVRAAPETLPEVYAAVSPIERPACATPVLVVHGDADDRVPVEHSRDHVAARRGLGDPIELLELRGADHFVVIDPDAPFGQTVGAWVELTLDRAAAGR